MKAMIVGVSGLFLTQEEKHFITKYPPFGFILFARNIDNEQQVKALTDELRQISLHKNVPIFIDQEGGRVQRLRPPLCENYPTAATLGEIYTKDKKAGLRAAWLLSRLHAFDLMRFGINANCLPLLDVPILGAHDVIGDRAYSTNPQIVTKMGNEAAKGLMAGGVLPVMKHIPGHGRAFCDTHLELARVDATLDVLEQNDFMPFKALANLPVAMTAHVVYESIDAKLPATLSPKVVQDYIRGYIGFDGLLMTDDVSMKALSGNFGELAKNALNAGCDVVLHCNGNMQEMQEIAENTPELKDKALIRANIAQNAYNAIDNSIEDVLREEFAKLLAL